MIENGHFWLFPEFLQRGCALFPPFSLTHNFWRQIWATRRLVVCTITPLQLGAYSSSKNQNHSVKLLLNKLTATNQRKVTKCFKIAVDRWPILQGRPEDFTWTSTYSACSLWLSRLKWHKYIHCTSSGRLNTVLEYIKCIKEHVK